MFKLFNKKPYLVWHVQGTGHKIVVFRNWFQLKMFGNHIHKSETDFSWQDLACAIDLT